MLRRASFLAAIFSLLFASVAYAQTTPDTEEGVKPYGVYSEGDIDSVSMTSGNLLLHIPVVSYPQRGNQLNLSFHLYYSNKGWTRVAAAQTGHYIWQNFGFSGVTFAMDDLQQTGEQIVQISCLTDTGKKGGGTCPKMQLPFIISPDGSRHQVGTLPGGALNNSGSGETVDGTGMMYIPPAGNGPAIYTAIDRNGVRSLSGVPDPNNANATDSILEDTEGNEIVQSTTGWTDTLGRNLPGTWIPNPNTFEAGWDITPSSGVPPYLFMPGVPSADLSKCPANTQSAYVWNVPSAGRGTEPYIFCYETITYMSGFTSQQLGNLCTSLQAAL